MDENIIKYAPRILIVLILFLILFSILIFTGTVKCNAIPGGCNIYYAIKGQPKVLIVYGDNGLGDPVMLQKIFNDRQKFSFNAHVTAIHLNNINPGNLRQFDLVIVTKAKTMSTQKMKMFIDYALFGGKLVWTGDAGTQLERTGIERGDYLYEDEDPTTDLNKHKIINPWARKLEGKVVFLNKLLGVNFEGVYCQMTNCIPGSFFIAGNLNPLDRSHELVKGLRATLPLEIEANKDFAVVTSLAETATTNIVVLETGSKVIGNFNYGNTIPFIVVAGKSQILGYNIGENVVYYAMPLEYFANDKLPEEHRYYSFIENMYYGLLYGNF